MNEIIDEILKGSYDLHVHAGPDATQERRLDALDVARHAYEAEMGGFVLKSHDYMTAPLAYMLGRVYPGLDVVGAISLNRGVGGLNPEAVRVAGALGAKVVWMPTFDAHFFLGDQDRGAGIRLMQGEKLRPEIGEILDIIAANDMVLASGHVSPSEVIALFKEAKIRGVNRMIATHPAGAATMPQQQEMIALGAYSEYTFLSCMPSHIDRSPEEMISDLRALGVDHCIVTTDFGQWMNPPPAEGMRMAIAALLDGGMTPDEVSVLVKTNPSRLVAGASA